jgi:outer membrane lipoprotein carrier protein
MRLLACLLAFAGAARAAETDAVVGKVQKYYDATRDLRAHFEQTLKTAIGSKKKASGELLLKKPGKMRWDYAKPEKKLMVSDGTTLWVYEPEDEQAFKQNLAGSTLPVQVSFLVGQGKLADEFEIAPDKTATCAAGAGAVALKLVPKKATTAYRYLTFCVDDASGQVKETIVHDQQDGENHLIFSDVKQNAGVDDGKFHFAPPAGTKIITP